MTHVSKVLIVHPDGARLEALRSRASRAGYEAAAVGTVKEAVRALRARRPALIIASATMRDLEALQERPPETGLILLMGDEGAETPILMRGAYACLPESTPWPAMVATIRAAVEHQAMVRSFREFQTRAWTLFDSIGDAVFLYDLEGRILEANEVMGDRLGYRREALMGMSVSEIEAPPHEGGIDSQIAVLQEQGQGVFRSAHRRRDGSTFPVEISARLIRYGGRPTVISVARDISQRVEAEARVRRYVSQLEALREVSLEISAELDVDTLLHSIVSRAVDLVSAEAGGLYLYEPERDALVRSVSVGDYAPPEGTVRDRGEGLSGRVWAGDRALALDDYAAWEGRVGRPGLPEDAAALGLPVRWGEEFLGVITVSARSACRGPFNGAETEMMGIFARHAAIALHNAQLLESVRSHAERLNAVMHSVPEGLALVGTEGQVLLANPAGERHLKVLADASVGDRLSTLGGEPWRDWLEGPAAGLWHELTAEVPDRRDFELIAEPVRRDDRLSGWIFVIRDVTYEREVAARTEQQARLAAVGQLAAGIAHDFNNIMAVIVLYAQMLQSEPELSAGGQRRLMTITEQAHRATELIQQILDFSRSSALERHPLDLRAFLKEQIRMLERMLPDDIRVRMRYDDHEYRVSADPTRIQQAVMNLAVNARDAMDGGGTLTLRLDRLRIESGQDKPLPELAPGPWVILEISDTGAGIPEAVRPHIFEPFFTTKEEGRGTGLGLPQVHGIVKQHGGEIQVESRVGAGSAFRIYLPALVTLDAESGGDGEAPVLQGHGELILVVEDNPTTRMSLVESLNSLNYEVIEAQNGEEALTGWVRHRDRIALVLTDLVMPDLGGRDLACELRARGAKVPIILLSGRLMADTAKGLADDVITAWVHKPVDLRHLAEVVAEHVAG